MVGYKMYIVYSSSFQIILEQNFDNLRVIINYALDTVLGLIEPHGIAFPS